MKTEKEGEASWHIVARRASRTVIAIAVVTFFTVLALKNVAPFGARVEYNITLDEAGVHSHKSGHRFSSCLDTSGAQRRWCPLVFRSVQLSPPVKA